MLALIFIIMIILPCPFLHLFNSTLLSKLTSKVICFMEDALVI
jgi:hypothetical protein